jgi:preprotein translocase subunit YajC
MPRRQPSAADRPFVLILAIFYFIILLPSKRKQQKVQEFLENLKVNDRVITTSGIYGQIAKINGDKVALQVADKVRIDVSKAAIGGYQGSRRSSRREPITRGRAPRECLCRTFAGRSSPSSPSP